MTEEDAVRFLKEMRTAALKAGEAGLSEVLMTNIAAVLFDIAITLTKIEKHLGGTS